MLDHITTYVENDEYAKSLGIAFIEIRNEYAKCELEIRGQHRNAIGSLHGAVIFSLADIAFGAACNTLYTSIGMQAEIKYLNKPVGNRLCAEAKLVSGSRKIGNYAVSITDDQGTLVASMSSICYRLRSRDPDPVDQR